MDSYPKSVAELIEEFEKLPSIGNKTAVRLAFYILNSPYEIAQKFSEIVGKAVALEGNWTVIPHISTEIMTKILVQFPAKAINQTGFGDVSIVEQFEDYWENKQPIGEMRIWSQDRHLQSYSRVGGLRRRKDR
jgi:hypothetical protein